MNKSESESIATMSDFPKIHCPLIRQTFKINQDDWKKVGKKMQLRDPEVYLVVNKINPGFEWVFEDADTFAVEKLDGTNVKIKVENGRLIAVQNRKNVIDPLQILKGKTFLMEGIFKAIDKEYVKDNCEQVGEILGPKLQANPYKLLYHEWYPFERAIEVLRYTSFDKHERNFDNWSSWFKDFLRSRYYMKLHKCQLEESVFAEGVIFYNLKRRAENKSWMAKLRRNMFDWYYQDQGVKIFDYSKEGRAEIEDQEKFD
ncbi:MAG: hypothetical protein HQK49_14445 [Oligoflexia bacterium]|nr:hypothetical protein [Oligoflexia bacterium]